MDHLKPETLPLPVTDSSQKKRPHLIRFLAGIVDVIRTNLSAGVPPSSSSSYGDDDISPTLDVADVGGTVITSEKDGGYVEKVVVEQSWGGTRQPTSDSSDPEHNKDGSKSGDIQPVQITTEHEIENHSNSYFIFLLRIWLKIKHFFYPRPFDVGSEKRYNEDDWYSKKTLAQFTSVFLILTLAFGIPSVPRPWTTIDYVFYSGIAPAITLPVFVMIMFSWPRDHPIIYQLFIVTALWMWPFDLVINMRICAFYVPNNAGALLSCNHKDFINIFFYATAMQAMGLFGLRLERIYAAVAAALWFVVSSALIIPEHSVWWRSMVNYALFQIFIIWVHERRESSERRLYAMKVQVKIQYKALQRAQANERKTTESKHRLTSYVFHEVRVPLNSALLAAQSMESSGTVSKNLEVEFDALMGSLTMMSQVLNDVLDFNRLDSGQFELVSKPYAFHQTLRSLFIPLAMATAQKRLELHTDLDPNIDKVARCAAYRAMGEREDVINRHLEEHPDVDGVVVGDEARFRQIITNFASNACKFTPEGGSVTVKTRLVIPSVDESSGLRDGLSASRLAQHDYDHANDKDESIVVRIEVTDTGCGIEGPELTGPKLFSAFNQTERGKQQGGKGTGLGLALVRNIVKLSGGRLGVKSQFNKGSTFWVELPLGVGRKALIPTTGINISNAMARMDSQGSEGSMGSDIAKVRAAAAQRESLDGNHLTTRNSLTKVVDVAALKASEMSSGSTMMHSTIMEQAGRVDLVVESQTPSVPLASIRASPSIMSAASTPNTTTDHSFSFHSHHSRGTPQSEKSQNLSISSVSAGAGVVVELPEDGKPPAAPIPPPPSPSLDSEGFLPNSNSRPTPSDRPPPTATDEEPPPPTNTSNTSSTATIQRPTHIPIPPIPLNNTPHSDIIVLPSTAKTSSSGASSLTLFDNSFSRTQGGYNATANNSHIHSKPNPSGLHPVFNTTTFTKNNTFSPDFSPGLSVLVVDDDGITRMMMERVLKRQNCDVTTAENGRVALELILGDEWDPAMLESVVSESQESRDGSRTHSRPMSFSDSVPDFPSTSKSSRDHEHETNGVPALFSDSMSREMSQGSEKSHSTVAQAPSKFAVVFLDNSMPVLNGIRTVEILRKLRRNDFIVGLTGNALLPDQEEYLQAGVDIVLTKPVMQSKLLYVLKEADARRQHHLSLLQNADSSAS